MIGELTLAVMLARTPHAPRARLEDRAVAFELAAKQPGDLEFLVSTDLVETGWGRAGVPLGACARLCRRACGPACRVEPLKDTALAMVVVWRRSGRECGPDLALRLGWYRTGACRADGEAHRRARCLRRFARRLGGAR